MEKKKKQEPEIVELGYRGYFILVSIVLLAACLIIALLMNHIKNNNLEIRELKSKIEENNIVDCPDSTMTIYLSEKDLVRKVYDDKLAKESTLESYNIEDISIEDINQFIGSGQYAKNYPTASSDSVFAIITYSVKPIGYSKTIWNNGNGTSDNDWVKNKKAYVHIKKTEKGYVIDGDGYGTKW